MRREELYLRDIVEAADAAQRFIAGVTEEEFFKDDMRQSAVLQKLMLIGEATARLPESLRIRYPNIPWADIVGFRNIAIHDYFSVDMAIVWTTVTKDLAELRPQISEILNHEFDIRD